MPARKTCFLVMPFRVKPTGLEVGTGPESVDFDRLFQLAIEPALNELGYDIDRADQDAGALIIKEMIERIAYSDLVVADVSIPNGNVYYEVGIRHAARDRGCVMIAADWSEQLFDVDQMRRVVYPLADGGVSADVAEKAKQVLIEQIPALADGKSPFFDTVKHEPVSPDGYEGLEVFREHTRTVNGLLGRFRSIDEYPEEERKVKARELRDEIMAAEEVPDTIRTDVISLLRDNAEWTDVVEYIETLDETLRADRWVEEQRLLAGSKSGDVEDAIGALLLLIEKQGQTAERCGLLGGRHKRLWRKYRDEGDEKMAKKNLAAAIKAYQDGMRADLNDYYASSNLPLLLRARGRRNDPAEATFISRLVVEQAERALRVDENDPWVRQTLLGAAFDAGDAEKAEELAERIEDEGAVSWNLESTLADLRDRASNIQDPEAADRLEAVVEQLEDLI
ncbi:MAG: TRAFs-binding domain-containing protein [Ilumatobacteraceae bacterium]